MAIDNITPDEHQKIIIGLSAERNAVIKGMAGSGKSLVMLKKAKQVSTETDSYAIIVYTKSLKQFFVDELAEIDPTGKHVYYHWEWQHSSKPRYKYLFIDECQDFSTEEVEDFKSHGTYCWFFGDTDQSIMKFRNSNIQSVEKTAEQIGVHPQDLCINYRLTIENAKIGEYINPSSRLSFACIKHGPKPKIIRTNDNKLAQVLGKEQSQLDRIIDIIKSGQLLNVGILVYYTDSVELIRDYFLSKGISVEWKTKDGMVINFKSTNPKIINWHCAKGLQFNNVFIPACGVGEHELYHDRTKLRHPIDPVVCKSNESALYVATTRPLDNLYLLYSDILSPMFPPVDSDIYINYSEGGVDEEEWIDPLDLLKSKNIGPF